MKPRKNNRKEKGKGERYWGKEKSVKLSRTADRLIKQAELNQSLKNFEIGRNLLDIFDEEE